MMRSFIVVSLILLLSCGCSTTLPLNYIPSSAIRGQTHVTVGSFRYLPAVTHLVGPNQFQKNPSAIGEVFISTDVATFVKSALRKELAYSGFKLDGAEAILVVSGDVTRFYYDWIGFSEVDFEIGIDFRIKKGGEQLFEYSTFSHQKAPKSPGMSQDPEAVRAAVSACIEDFLTVARTKGVL